MKGSLNHIELRVSKPDETIPFYKEMLGYFEWHTVAEWPGGLGMSDGNASLWFFPTSDDHRQHDFDRDSTGISHYGIHVENAAAVDTFVSEFLQPKGIQPQFDTPRKREDFGPTYYQVMFLDPEGLAVEVYHS